MSKEQVDTKNKKETQDEGPQNQEGEHEMLHNHNTPSEKTEFEEDKETDNSIEEEVAVNQDEP